MMSNHIKARLKKNTRSIIFFSVDEVQNGVSLTLFRLLSYEQHHVLTWCFINAKNCHFV